MALKLLLRRTSSLTLKVPSSEFACFVCCLFFLAKRGAYGLKSLDCSW